MVKKKPGSSKKGKPKKHSQKSWQNKMDRAWLVAVFVPVTRLAPLMKRWGDAPSIIIPVKYPQKHRIWGTFVWVIGFDDVNHSGDWFPHVLKDKKLTSVWKPNFNKTREYKYFRGKHRKTGGLPGIFWLDIVQLNISQNKMMKLQKTLVKTGAWQMMALEMRDIYREAEDRVFQEAALSEEIRMMELAGEGKNEGYIPEDYTTSEYVDDFWGGDFKALVSKRWGITENYQALRYVEKALTKALNVKSSLENPYNTKE